MSERAKEILKEFERTISNVNLTFVDLQDLLIHLGDDDLMGHLAAYRTIYEAESLIAKLDKLAKETKQRLAYQVIPEIMERLKVDSMRYDGRNFIKTVTLRASIPEAKQSQGFKWLKDNGLGGAIKEGVNANTLSSIISHFIEETGITPPDDCITIHRQPNIQVRK